MEEVIAVSGDASQGLDEEEWREPGSGGIIYQVWVYAAQHGTRLWQFSFFHPSSTSGGGEGKGVL